jgi:hypothetical protein
VSCEAAQTHFEAAQIHFIVSCEAFVVGHSEPAPTSTPSRMDDMVSGYSLL